MAFHIDEGEAAAAASEDVAGQLQLTDGAKLGEKFGDVVFRRLGRNITNEERFNRSDPRFLRDVPYRGQHGRAEIRPTTRRTNYEKGQCPRPYLRSEQPGLNGPQSRRADARTAPSRTAHRRLYRRPPLRNDAGRPFKPVPQARSCVQRLESRNPKRGAGRTDTGFPAHGEPVPCPHAVHSLPYGVDRGVAHRNKRP